MIKLLDIDKSNQEIIDFLITKGFVDSDIKDKNISKIKLVISASKPIKINLEYLTTGIFTSERANTKEHLSKKD